MSDQISGMRDRMEIIVSSIITGAFALTAAILSKRAGDQAKEANQSAKKIETETRPNGGKSMVDKIDQLGRRLITMDARGERTERKVDQLSEDQDKLKAEILAVQHQHEQE